MFPGKMWLVLVLRNHDRSQAMLARLSNGLALRYTCTFVKNAWNMAGPRYPLCDQLQKTFTCTVTLHMHKVMTACLTHE